MIEYEAIKAVYQDKKAKRSGMPLMNHIDEGLIILNLLGATHATKAAYCLHPLFQTDESLAAEGLDFMQYRTSVYPVMLAMEYRARANACLSEQVGVEYGTLTGKQYFYMKVTANPGPLVEVKHMLIADKIQNRKDFELYHQDHLRAKELAFYFMHWLQALGISEHSYKELVSQLWNLSNLITECTE